MSAFENLKDKLREIFQLDRNDLDFGVYRIMNLKSEEVTKFIEEDLLPQVKAGLASYASDDSANLKEELEKTVAQLRGAGLTEELINTTPKVVELNERLKDAFSPEKIENEIYSDLYNFFKRYYSDGDFMSLRRYKDGVYALPYEGEEVKLHWANADQYYIKSSETLSNYTFKVRNRKIRFEVVDATTEQNNNKDDKNRRFRLYKGTEEEPKNPVSIRNGEFVVAFTYLATEGSAPTQRNINEEIFAELWANPLLVDIAESLKSTTSDVSRLPILQKHINNFTAKNTFDYFIHKDLRGFLNRELDFFIKNEIMHLDDIENEPAANVEQYLGKIKVLRAVVHKIIDFLTSIENFQKKLWLKKKFVLETNYCITLDRVPEELYPEIVANNAQRDEWIKLFAIDEIKGEELESVAYSNPLTIEFLKANPFLVLDTQFFSTEFKYKLLSDLDNLDEKSNGLLIHSENFQALELIQNKYLEKIQCVYIDPPYNTDATPILYKNTYKDSSWLSLLGDRLKLGMSILDPYIGYYSVAIDDVELHNLYKLMEQTMPRMEFLQTIVNHYPGSGTGRSNVTRTHEYNIFAIHKNTDILRGDIKPSGERYRSFCRSGTGDNNFRRGRPKSFYAVLVDPIEKRIVGFEPPPSLDSEYPKDKTPAGYIRIYPFGSDGSERCWSLSYESAKIYLEKGMLECSTNNVIKRKYYDVADRDLLPSIWIDSKYSAVSYGTNLLTSMFGASGKFSFPKSLYTVLTAIEGGCYDELAAIVLDFFAGSGTTGHAVINLNRQDNGRRKYILCEMGNYFDTVTKPRIEKVIYSEDWKDGKPLSRKGSSHMFKYIRLESYEDCLDNLKFERSKTQEDWLENNKTAKEEYMLKYMMDLETKDSLLCIKKFDDPFGYKINITRDGEVKESNVDLVETFNYLIGLYVDHIQTFKDILVVEGVTREGEKTLVIWRNTSKTDSDALDSWFKKCKYSTLDAEFDVIYVNGDNNLENLRRDDQTWKVRLIEAEFNKRMFDVQDVK